MSQRMEWSNFSTSTIPPSTGNFIDDKGVRYSWISYYLFVLVSSLVGDAIILAASTQPNGIRLNKFIVTVMQHIAVSDLMSCFSFVLPKAASLIDNRWVLNGPLINIILNYVDEVIFVANTILIALLSMSKLLMLKYPTHTPRWTIKRAHIGCGIFWLIANVFPAIFLVLEYYYTANSSLEAPWLKNADFLRIGITMVLPTFIMIVTTILILCYLIKARKVAKRSGGRTRYRGVATVVITAIIYCISVIPFAWVATYTYIDHEADITLLAKISQASTGLNIMSNIYVYYLTIPSLREFIRVKILRRTPLILHPTATESMRS